MRAGVRIGFAIPQAPAPGPAGIRWLRQCLTAGESYGFQSLWVQEQILGGGASLEPLTLLGFAAALTERVALGVSVLVLPQHHPIHLAKRAATLDQLSGGRLLLGVGLGSAATYSYFGVPREHRVGRFVEQIQVMKSLWSEPQSTFKGRFYDFESLAMEPKPLQQPHPRLWFGGSSPQALQRAVTLGDGWMGAGASTVAEFRGCVAQIRHFLTEKGRDPLSYCVSKRVYIAVEAREGRAKRRLEDWFRLYYRDADMATRVAIWGNTGRVAERLEELVAAGATDLVINPVFDELATMAALAPVIGRMASERRDEI